MDINGSASLIIAIVFIFIIFIILIGWIAAEKTYQSGYDNSKIKIFISVITGFGIFITFLWFFSTMILQYNRQRLEETEHKNEINKKIWSDLKKNMIEASYKIPEFIFSLNPFTPFFYEKKERAEVGTNELIKQKISGEIFSSWEFFLNSKKMIKGDPSDISNHIYEFLQWATSPLLMEEWNKLKFNFNKKTITFGDNLFHEAQNESNVSKFSFEKLSKKLTLKII